ncbi:hypothetical protein [Sulfitobacter mediterraneus]|uniref:Uncharacterized protein n=1 Tax=Sulfitobacter mediterraneus TaxID=83219 RepID=A0A061SUS1_9RHOB|nr:hypothetical protein [Sulfitobacter mediterraneus]KAJ03090.1 hypothetical protein PM02_11175 [Sulfitobacter mediterraneus]
MIYEADIAAKSKALRDLLREKYGVKSRNLAVALARTGRRMPPALHRQAEVLIRAEQEVRNPKLALQWDVVRIDEAYEAVAAHLRQIDVKERRKSQLLRMAGLIVFYLLVVLGTFVFWMWWRGYV